MTEFDLPRRSAYHDDELSKKATAGTDAPACGVSAPSRVWSQSSLADAARYRRPNRG